MTDGFDRPRSIVLLNQGVWMPRSRSFDVAVRVEISLRGHVKAP